MVVHNLFRRATVDADDNRRLEGASCKHLQGRFDIQVRLLLLCCHY
jgi:hypothetical protein